MRKLMAVLTLVVCSLFLVRSPAMAEGGNADKVTICHRTNSVTNPYVQITVDRHAVDGVKNQGADHYGQHTGSVFDPTLKAMKIKWGDIVPPVAGFHEGLNWTEAGISIYKNGCKVATSPTTTTTETTVVTPTTETPTKTDTPTGEVERPAPAAVVDELPRTGNSEVALAVVGVTFIGLGAALVTAGLLRRANGS